MSPLPATRVIHKNFSAHHQPTAESAMTATGTIARRPTHGTMNPTTGAVTYPNATVIAANSPARIQAAPGLLRPRLAGDELITGHDYLVQVPTSVTGVRVDDWFTVETAHDSDLVGRDLRVLDVTYGSEGFTLDLICRDELR